MKSIITLLLVTISIISQAQSAKEIFDTINEYRTEVIGINTLLYNDSAQHISDIRAKEIARSFKADNTISNSSYEVIMETKHYDAILEKVLKDKEIYLSEKNTSVCISLLKKGKTFYCVIMVWDHSVNSLGVTSF